MNIYKFIVVLAFLMLSACANIHIKWKEGNNITVVYETSALISSVEETHKEAKKIVDALCESREEQINFNNLMVTPTNFIDYVGKAFKIIDEISGKITVELSGECAKRS